MITLTLQKTNSLPGPEPWQKYKFFYRKLPRHSAVYTVRLQTVEVEMAQTLLDLDRKIARSAGLPAFLQRHIQFKEASTDDRPAIVHYNSKFNSKKTHSAPSQDHSLYDKSQLQLEWPTIGKVGGGLRNLGNTCFLNACLQCLHYTTPLNLYLFNEHKKRCLASIHGDHCMLCELMSVFRMMQSTPHISTPAGIVSRIKGIARHFKPGRQEDAHEFLRYFVDALVRSSLYGIPTENLPAIKDTTLVHAVFGGLLRSCITCACCGHKSITHDPFLDISLEIKNTDSVQAALSQFCKREALTKGNRYRCESCKELSEASKQMLIDRAPAVLTLHLKRFSTFGMSVGKLHQHLEFANDLDLSPYCTDPGSHTLYKLYGVIVHDGQSTHSGHYYSFIKASNALWYCMNDESVSQVSINTVLKQKAYILFYRRVSSPINNAISKDPVLEETINVDECSDVASVSVARSSTMWHMTSNTGMTSGQCASGVSKSRKDRRIKWRISKVK